jgi:hypothetical protein
MSEIFMFIFACTIAAVIVGVLAFTSGCGTDKPRRIEELCYMRADGIVICPDREKK